MLRQMSSFSCSSLGPEANTRLEEEERKRRDAQYRARKRGQRCSSTDEAADDQGRVQGRGQLTLRESISLPIRLEEVGRAPRYGQAEQDEQQQQRREEHQCAEADESDVPWANTKHAGATPPLGRSVKPGSRLSGELSSVLSEGTPINIRQSPLTISSPSHAGEVEAAAKKKKAGGKTKAVAIPKSRPKLAKSLSEAMPARNLVKGLFGRFSRNRDSPTTSAEAYRQAPSRSVSPTSSHRSDAGDSKKKAAVKTMSSPATTGASGKHRSRKGARLLKWLKRSGASKHVKDEDDDDDDESTTDDDKSDK